MTLKIIRPHGGWPEQAWRDEPESCKSF